MAVTGASTPQQPVSARLRSAQVGMRNDLEVSRHVFRGVPTYIVRDPMTFHSQRLDLADYEMFVHIQSSRSLGDIFDELVAKQRLTPQDEEPFYGFVVNLHRLGFLQLPIADEKLLYRRYAMREQARRRARWMGFLFLRVPMLNPNAFLDRTLGFVRPMFARWALVVWLVLVAAAAFVVLHRWDELLNPLHGLLLGKNLVLLWATLIVLKIFHEFGHAYACKHYGGHVPEMGIYLILFTPCAYVDATASWSFTRKRDRIIVCLAGLYVELALAALAVFVWALTEDSLLRSIAYNVIFLASTVTVLFNVNPLMRYDGYYILSDWLEIPNLRQRATQHVLNRLKRVCLGAESQGHAEKGRAGLILTIYGVAAGAYRVLLILGIAAVLASKMLLLGVALGALIVGESLVAAVFKLTNYLWYAEETRACRGRAAVLSILVLLIAPAAVAMLPIPWTVHAPGVLAREREQLIRAPAVGSVDGIGACAGQVVAAGQSLVLLGNDALQERVDEAGAELRASQIRLDAFRAHDASKASQELAVLRGLQERTVSASNDLVALRVLAPESGELVETLHATDVGRFVAQGAPLGLIASGAWDVRAAITAEQLSSARASLGQKVSFRSVADPGRVYGGTIVRIAPAGSKTVEFAALTQLGGGPIAVDPATQSAAQPYFDVHIRLADPDVSQLRHRMTGVVQFPARAEPLGRILGRQLARFWQKLFLG